VIVSQMRDCLPGATPVLIDGLIDRKAVTDADSFSDEEA
jgi:hypothetical protein